MKTRTLIAVVVLTHLIVIGSVLCMQGCRTKGPGIVEPPPSPVMPPRGEGETFAPPAQPVFQPPTPVQPAPALTAPLEGQSYKIQPGDSLSKIAARAGVSVRELVELNNIKDPNKIRVGQTIRLPDYARSLPAGKATVPAATHAAPKKSHTRSEPKAPEGGSVYVVVAGDSLSKIAARHGVKVADLRAANQLSGDKILIGQKLVIPGKASGVPAAATTAPAKTESAPAVSQPQTAAPTLSLPPPVAQPPQPAMEPQSLETAPATSASSGTAQMANQSFYYTSTEDTTVENIAKLFAVDVNELMALNGFLNAQQKVSSGQRVLIPSITQ